VLTSDRGRFVYVLNDNDEATQRPVSVDNWRGKDWIILEGLQTGDRVVVDNLIKLMPGKKVEPQAQDQFPSPQPGLDSINN